MSINIIGGVAKGFSLETPRSFKTRPTSVLLKRRLFDSKQDFSNCTFVDLCAGTGSIGIEALSRNAEEVILIENEPNAFKILKNNTKSIQKKYPDLKNCKIIKTDAIEWIKKNIDLYNREQTFLFFDPPYEIHDLYDSFMKIIIESQFKGTVIIEACRQKTMTSDEFQKQYGNAKKMYKQGTSYFLVYSFS